MSISRLNTYRAFSAPTAAPARTASRAGSAPAGTVLTDRDRELIRQATGQDIGPGEVDPGRLNALAAAITADRTAGRLAPGQEVTEFYLRDLARRAARDPAGRDPIAGYLEPALSHLHRQGYGARLDVSA